MRPSVAGLDRRQPQGRAGRRILRARRRQGRRARAIVAEPSRAAPSPSSPSGGRSALGDAVVRRSRRCARGARPRRRALLSAPARDDRRRHRHQRQDLGRRLRAPDLGARSASRRPRSAPSASSRAPRTVYGSLTTPDPVTLHRTLDAARAATASPIWRWRRPRTGSTRSGSTACASPPAAFTNLSRDHLDYHATLDDYLDAKLRLFRELAAAGRAPL